MDDQMSTVGTTRLPYKGVQQSASPARIGIIIRPHQPAVLPPHACDPSTSGPTSTSQALTVLTIIGSLGSLDGDPCARPFSLTGRDGQTVS